jgi:hypothetical protein
LHVALSFTRSHDLASPGSWRWRRTDLTAGDTHGYIA